MVMVVVEWKGLEEKKIIGGGEGGGKGLQEKEREGRRVKELMVGLVGWRRLSGAGCRLEFELLYELAYCRSKV